MTIKKTKLEKVYESIEDFTKELNKKDKLIKKLNDRIDYLEGKEYYQGIEKQVIESTILKVLYILKDYPRSDNFSINGRLVSADTIIKERLHKLGALPTEEDNGKKLW